MLLPLLPTNTCLISLQKTLWIRIIRKTSDYQVLLSQSRSRSKTQPVCDTPDKMVVKPLPQWCPMEWFPMVEPQTHHS